MTFSGVEEAPDIKADRFGTISLHPVGTRQIPSMPVFPQFPFPSGLNAPRHHSILPVRGRIRRNRRYHPSA